MRTQDQGSAWSAYKCGSGSMVGPGSHLYRSPDGEELTLSSGTPLLLR